MKVAILGSTGYTGQILLRILLNHPDVRQIYPVSFTSAGLAISRKDPGLSIGHSEYQGNEKRSSESQGSENQGSENPEGESQGSEKLDSTRGLYMDIDELRRSRDPDIIFAALPHLKSAETASEFSERAVIIDLSADFRIPDSDLFSQAYGQAAPCPDLLPRAVYGLSEWKRAEIRRTDLIANPGCYPTATLLPLLPLTGLIQGQIIVNALSGISGAGRKVQERFLYTSRTENIAAYSPGKSHRHWQEMNYHLSDISGEKELALSFIPHLVPVHHGMAVSSSVTLKEGISDEQIAESFEQCYRDSPFVRLRDDIPETSQVRGSNRCDFTWRREGEQLFLLSVIDNLYKGASGQAVQNMNIRFGLHEQAGLQFHGEI